MLGIQLFRKQLNSLIKMKSECNLFPLVLPLTNSVFYSFCRLIRKVVKVNFTKRSYIMQFKKLMLLKKILLQDKSFVLMVICFLCGFGTDILFIKLKHYSLRTFFSKKKKLSMNMLTLSVLVYHKHLCTRK